MPVGGDPGLHEFGFAAGTRQFNAFSPLHVVERIHAVMLTGGSAFGLETGAGAMAWLAEQGIGHRTIAAHVPIVPTAVIYDLAIGPAGAHPTKDDGYRACAGAASGELEQGSVGAGTGAVAGKLFGIDRGVKAGLGMSSVTRDGIIVGALAVVNPVGDVIDPERRTVFAGARRSPTSHEFLDITATLTGSATPQPATSAATSGGSGPLENTTLVVVVTNARMTKLEATFVASMSSQALPATISPVGTQYDGDLVIALSCGAVASNPHLLGLMGRCAVERAIRRSVEHARSLGGIPSLAELESWRGTGG